MALKQSRVPMILLLLVAGAAVVLPAGLRCGLCGRDIGAGERYFQVKDGSEIFCERCYAEAPRCKSCRLPVDGKSLDPESGICAKCIARLPRCKACGKPIAGTFYKFSSSDGVFCSECRRTRPACAICGAPVGPKYFAYPDGRNICDDCGKRAVFDQTTIEDIVKDVRRTMEKHLGLQLKNPFQVIVQELSGISPPGAGTGHKPASAHVALYGKELGLYRFEDGRSEIYLLYGLPPDLLYETAAHECAHAWQLENCPVELSPELREGFAQWVAAEVLLERGFHVAWERLDARKDAPYGTGYQRIKSMDPKAVLELLLKRR